MLAFEDRMKEWEGLLGWNQETCQRLYRDMLVQCQKGLNMHKKDSTSWRAAESDLMYFDTCLTQMPSGKETGVFYALDFGGTNVRVIRTVAKGEGKPLEITQHSENIRDVGKSEELPNGIRDPKATATMLFDTLADVVKRFMQENGDIKSSKKFPMGFTFSFGIRQTAIDVAFLSEWSKEFMTGTQSNDPVVGQDVCHLMNEAFRRAGVPCKVVGACNDTTGTMIAGAMEKKPSMPPCLVGIIVGTGFNGCYYEPDAAEYGYRGTVINTESGNFRGSIPLTVVDVEINHYSAIPGQMVTEKILSGHYVPEVIRLVMLRVFQREAPQKAWTPYSISCAATAKIYNEPEGSTEATAKVMQEVFGWAPSEAHLRCVKKIVDLVWKRSAALCAVIIAGLAKKTRRLQPALGGVTVGIDGSMYCQNPRYQEHCRQYLELILGSQLASLIQFQVSGDGSGKGAACLAAGIAGH